MKYTTQISIAILTSFIEYKLIGTTNIIWIILGTLLVDIFSIESPLNQICPIASKALSLGQKIIFFIDFNKFMHSCVAVGILYMVTLNFPKNDMLFHLLIGYGVHLLVDSLSENGAYILYPVLRTPFNILNIKSGTHEMIFNTVVWLAIIAIFVPIDYWYRAKDEAIKLTSQIQKEII